MIPQAQKNAITFFDSVWRWGSLLGFVLWWARISCMYNVRTNSLLWSTLIWSNRPSFKIMFLKNIIKFKSFYMYYRVCKFIYILCIHNRNSLFWIEYIIHCVDLTTWTCHISQYCFSLAWHKILVCILNIHQWNKHVLLHTWPAFHFGPCVVCVHNIQPHMGVGLSAFQFVFDVVDGR